MRELTHELLQMVRMLGILEKDQICCGTVTVPQCVVLQTLLEGEYKVTDLAQYSGVSPSAMTRLLDGLVRKEWIERTHAKGDRRKVLIQLTPAGRAEAERLRALTEECLASVFSFIPEDKRETVMESVGLLSQAVEKAMDAGLSCCSGSSKSS